jgi:hypothetical protein
MSEDRKKLLLIAISQVILFLVGLYLSLASIIVLPLFKLPTNIDVKKSLNELDTFMNEVGLSEKEYYSRYLSNLVDIQSPNNDSLSFKIKPQVNIDKYTLVDYCEVIIRSRQEILNIKRQASNNYYVQLSEPVYNNLKNYYKLQIQGWFVSEVSDRCNKLDRLARNMKLLDFALKTRNSKSDTLLMIRKTDIYKLINNIQQNPVNPPPLRPAMGDDLGAFKWLSGWLAKTNFPALVLIVGLLGFGLLGDNVSTFFKLKDIKEDWIYSFFKTIIVGFTASIIVFLATMGGLIIYNGNTTETNGYILFFVCFAGAIYSDSIYEWVKGKMGSMFPGK